MGAVIRCLTCRATFESYEGLERHACIPTPTHGELAAEYAKRRGWSEGRTIAALCEFIEGEHLTVGALRQFFELQED